MPWMEVKTMELRREFVLLARTANLPFTQLCRRYNIAPKTGYKWLHRFETEGQAGLEDRSRRPHHQPRKTSPHIEQAVLKYRQECNVWSGRKIARLMKDDGHTDIPSPSTITEILRRRGLLHPGTSSPTQNYIRFEHPFPNDLWQMDFKGDFPLARGRCHTLTVLDDHSRYSLCLAACANERHETVKQHLSCTFERYGLPLRMTMDNGSPWRSGGHPNRLTQLTVWLIEHGIAVSHSRPYHPQTQGKDERFHRTLKDELVGRQTFADLARCQAAYGPWRDRYNTRRPHEALDMDTPIQHYEPSPRAYQPNPEPYEYGVNDKLRTVGRNMTISFKYHTIGVGKALIGRRVALRPSTEDGVYTMHFCHQQIGKIDLKTLTKRGTKTYNSI